MIWLNAMQEADKKVVENAKSDYKRWRDADRQVTCHCAAYTFPHRMGSGRCVAEQGEPLCSQCRLPADGKTVDEGIGHYEFWGSPGVDHQWVTVSECCEAGFVANTRKGEPISVEVDNEVDY